jgi:hypothetical protein
MRGSPDQSELFLGWFAQAIERGSPIERMMARVAIGVHDHARAGYGRAAEPFERAMALVSPAEHAGAVRPYGRGGGFYGHVLAIVVLWKLGRCVRSVLAPGARSTRRSSCARAPAARRAAAPDRGWPPRRHGT